MAFLVTESNEAFIFPYHADHENGRTNNGGFDLLADPDAIDQVTETKDFNALRECLLTINKPDGHFMTLGCESGLKPEKDGFLCLGYLEIAFRNPKLLARKDSYLKLVELFETDLKRQFPDFSFEPYLNFDLSQVVFRQLGSTGFKLAMFYFGPGRSESHAREQAGGLLSSFAQFLVESAPKTHELIYAE